MSRFAVALALGLVAAGAAPGHAEHDHSQHHGTAAARDSEPAAPRVQLSASLGAMTATYRQRLYSGDYAGVTVGAALAAGRFALAATVTGYRIERNGVGDRGVGDTMIHGSATLLARGALATGVQLMVMAPTGDAAAGLGMGHVMVMPAAWLALTHPGLRLAVSIGYSRGLGDAAAHAAHGSWPIVAPMSFSEVTVDSAVLRPLAAGLDAGVLTTLALPTGRLPARATTGARVRWRAGRVTTTLDVDGGLAGDPFQLRGTLGTAVSF